MQFRPFFQINDQGEFINLMSVGKVTVKKEEKEEGGDNWRPAVKKTEWTVTMVAHPGNNNITLTGERAEKFVEEYTNYPMSKSYL
jgi:hypothetical protein